jgi:hypothetical protein
MEFEWNPRKAGNNWQKHGVTFNEAHTVFADPLAKIFDDPDHSTEETREIIIGRSIEDRMLIVSFTERSGRVRIISARPATKRERSHYEEENPRT